MRTEPINSVPLAARRTDHWHENTEARRLADDCHAAARELIAAQHAVDMNGKDRSAPFDVWYAEHERLQSVVNRAFQKHYNAVEALADRVRS